MHNFSGNLVRTLILTTAISALSGCSPKKSESPQTDSEPKATEIKQTEPEITKSEQEEVKDKNSQEKETEKSSDTEVKSEGDTHKAFLDFAKSELAPAQSLTGEYTREPGEEWRFDSKYPSEVFGIFECSIQDFDGDKDDEMLAVALAGGDGNESLNLSIYEAGKDVAMTDLFVGTDGI